MPSNPDNSILNACEILFGNDVRVTAGFIRYLQPAGARAAFRRQVKERHPDVHTGDGDSFIRLQRAFEQVMEYLSRRDGQPASPGHGSGCGVSPKSAAKAAAPGQRTEKSGDNLYVGRLPSCSLRFGQYCYYRGMISWKTLIDAVCWQRRSRSDARRQERQLPIGQYFLDRGLVTRQELRDLVAGHRDHNRRYAKPLAESLR
jgi:hypothetical protein